MTAVFIFEKLSVKIDFVKQLLGTLCLNSGHGRSTIKNNFIYLIGFIGNWCSSPLSIIRMAVSFFFLTMLT